MKRQTKDIAALVALRGKATAGDIAHDLECYTKRDREAIARYLRLAEQEGLIAKAVESEEVYEYAV